MRISLLWSVIIISVVGIICAAAVIFFVGSYALPSGQYAVSGTPAIARASVTAMATTTITTTTTIITAAAVPSVEVLSVATTTLVQALPIAAASVGVPVGLIIPAININTTVAPAGVTADGAMGVPVGPTSTTWFDLGPRPGQIGSAVIAGHEGWKDGIFAIFDNLHELQPGDKIYVVDDQGQTTTFVVRSLALFGQDASAVTVFNSSDGIAHLNLITCEGTWNAAEKSYSDRLVVFADEVTTL